MASMQAFYQGVGQGWNVGGKTFMSSVLAKSHARQLGMIPSAPTTSPRPTIYGGGGGGGINKEALAAIQRAKAYYEPGGGFGKGVEAGLERGRTKAMASGMQGLVSAGLAGTTMAGGLGKKYEEEVAAPARAGVEGQRAQAISGIEMAQAGMGFQAGQAGAQRSLQMYIAQLQANLQREQMAMRSRPTVFAPTGGYARQFPSIYGQGGGPAAPPMPGGGGSYSGPGPDPRGYVGPTAGLPTATGGMALSGGGFLSPEQVEWK